MEGEKVVIVLDDETRVKGYVDGVDPRRARLQVREVDVSGTVRRIQDLDMHAVLTVFWVRDLAVARTRRSPAEEEEAPTSVPDGRRVRLTFVWGERLEGYAVAIPGAPAWFRFVPPPDSERADNIQSALVARRAVARAEPLDGGSRERHDAGRVG